MNRQERTNERMPGPNAGNGFPAAEDPINQPDDTATRARAAIGGSLDSMEMKFNDLRDSVVDRTKEYAQSTNRYLSRNPWKAIGISAGVAFLAGLLIGRKRGDS